ncbi:hypothetical protein Tco_0242759, partial [Tanacetum coccineum]
FEGVGQLLDSLIEHSNAFRFLSVPRPSQRSMINRTADIGGSVVLEKVTEEVVVQQPKPELSKSKRNRTLDCFDINSQSDYSSDDMKTTFLNSELDKEVYYKPASELHQ